MEQESCQSRLPPRASDYGRVRKFDQSGAICWRPGERELIEVLLVTSRDTGRWVIPKGNIDKREQLYQCAQREAREEAGVIGRVAKKAIGHYSYIKDPKRLPFVVSVFPLLVKGEAEKFREKGQRQGFWFPVLQAASLVAEPELCEIFQLIASDQRPKLFDKCLGQSSAQHAAY